MHSLTATTHYGDYVGTVSIDSSDTKNIYDQLAQNNNIDLSNQYLVSIKFEKIENIQQIIFITTNIGTTFNEIKNHLEHNDTLPCKEYYVDMNINDFLEYTKQFSFIYSKDKELINQKITIIDEE